MKSAWTSVGRWVIHARVNEEVGRTRCPAIVLVHGLGVSSRYLMPTARELEGRARVYAPDLPGFGRSSRPRRALNIEELADALALWMDAIGLERAAFLANSLGCQVVVDLALRYAERVESAVLVSPTIDPSGRGAIRQVARFLLNIPREPISLVPIALTDYLSAGLGRGLTTLHYALRDPIDEKLKRVQAPALVVRGERDPIVPQEWAERASRLLPRGRLHVVRGAAHAVNYNSPEQLALVALPFLCGEIDVP